MNIEKVSWGGWPNCYRLSNDDVELIVTTDVGPRVMRYAFIGGPNVFLELADELGKSGETEFRPRGGHRVWCAPERYPLSWAPDNQPVEVRVQGTNTIELTAPVEPLSGVRKTLLIRLAAAGTAVMVHHRIENTLSWDIELAAWPLSIRASMSFIVVASAEISSRSGGTGTRSVKSEVVIAATRARIASTDRSERRINR